MKILKPDVVGLKDIIWLCWKAQGEHLSSSIVTYFGLQVTFFGKLEHSLFIQIEVQSSRKGSLLEIFAHIGDLTLHHNSALKAEGCTNSVLYWSTICFIVFIPVVFQHFACVFNYAELSLKIYMQWILFLNWKEIFRLFTKEERWFPVGWRPPRHPELWDDFS